MTVFADRWRTAPPKHREFLDRAVPLLMTDERIVGLLAGGSLRAQTMDEHSDIDLVLAVEPAAHDQVMTERREIAGRLGNLVGAFTGEHVGEPRLLICLYDHPLLHVDFKFVALEAAAERVEEPLVLGDRDDRLAATLATRDPSAPKVSLEWVGDRVWIWIHYGIEKALRGELFECLDMLSYLRSQVLGPMITEAIGEPALPGQGVRRIETKAPEYARRLADCVGALDKKACLAALSAGAALYAELRDKLTGVPPRGDELAVRAYLDSLA